MPPALITNVTATTPAGGTPDIRYNHHQNHNNVNAAVNALEGLLSGASTGVTLNSPLFTGIPTAPTAGLGTNTTQVATTAFVTAAIAAGGGGGSGVQYGIAGTFTAAQTFNQGAFLDKGNIVTDARAYGVVADGQVVQDGAMTASSNVLNSATASFTSAVNGKLAVVTGAGSDGHANMLLATMTYVSATQVTLSSSASNTVSGAQIYWGTDNTTTMQAALTGTTSGWLEMPGGIILAPSDFMRNNNSIGLRGKGMSTTTLVTGVDSPGDNQEFHDFTLDVNNNHFFSGITSKGVGKLFRRVFVKNWGNFGIDLAYDTGRSVGAANCYVDECYFNHNGLNSVTGGCIILEGGYNNVHIENSNLGNNPNGGNALEIFSGITTLGAGQNDGFWFINNRVDGRFNKSSYVLGKNMHINGNIFATSLEISSSVGDDAHTGGHPFLSDGIEFVGNTIKADAVSGFTSWIQLIPNNSGINSTTLSGVVLNNNRFEYGKVKIITQNTTANILDSIYIENNTFVDADSASIEAILPSVNVVYSNWHIKNNSFNNWCATTGGFPAILFNVNGAGATHAFQNVQIMGNHLGPNTRVAAVDFVNVQNSGGATVTGNIYAYLNLPASGYNLKSDTAGVIITSVGSSILGITDFGGGEGATAFTTPSILLTFNGTNQYAHYVHTRHNNGTIVNNAIDFYTSDGTAAGVYPTNAVHGLSINGGKVGIGGRTSPTTTLDVNGTATITGFALTTSPGSGKVLTSDGTGNGTWQTPSAGGAAGSTTQIQYNNSGAFAGSASLVWDNTNKRVGVGTTTAPANTLSLGGGDGSVVFTSATVLLGFGSAGTFAHYIHTRHNGSALTNNAIDFYTGDTTSAGVYPTNAVHGLSINNGLVGGAGVTTPTAGFHAPASTTAAASLRVPSGVTPTSANAGDVWFDGTNLKFRNASATVSLDLAGTVTTASVVSANGFAGTVATATTTPAITLTTTITGLLKGSGTAISAATSGTDYSAGTSALATGILKSTTTTGALTIAVAADFPTLNQSTTGNAATATAALGLSSATTTVSVSAATAPTAGQVLMATSGTAATWQTPSSGFTNPMTTLGDMLYEDATPTAVRLAGNTTATKNFLVQTGTGSVSAAPSWGTISAGDVPTLNQNTTGTAANVTGTVAIANGGTGQTSAASAFNALSPLTTAGDLLYGGTAGIGTRLAAGTATQLLHGGTTPSWSAVSLTADVTGILPVANGGTGSGTQNFVDLTTAQNVAGVKTFTASQIIIGSGTTVGKVTMSNGSTDVLSYSSSGQLTISSFSGSNIILSTGTGDVTWSQNSVNAFFSQGSGAIAQTMTLKTGLVGIGNGVSTPTAYMHLHASTTSSASLRINNGSAPTSPNGGDLWNDGTNLVLNAMGLKTLNGSLTLGTAGNKLNITTGTNASAGKSTLVAGTVTVSTTAVTASSIIILTCQVLGTVTVASALTIGTVVAGTSFVINSAVVTDTSTIAWFIIN